MKALIIGAAALLSTITSAYALDYSQAMDVVNEEFMGLAVDPQNPQYPRMLVVRKSPDSPMPYSIMIPNSPPSDTRPQSEKDASDRAVLVQALQNAVNVFNGVQ